MLNVILLAVPVLLILLVLVLVVNSRHKKQMAAIEEIRQQLDEMTVHPVQTEETDCDEGPVEEQVVTEIAQLTEEKKGAGENEEETSEASAYNTGKSGKIYTKEELELLIKE